MNPFELTNDVDYLIEAAGTEVLINDEPTKAIITNYNLIGESEDRNIHTTVPVSLGDIVVYQDESYLIIKETVTKRHAKYKTLMRHCNLVFEGDAEIIGYEDKVIGRKPSGEPIIERVPIYGEPFSIPTIVSNKSFSIDERYSIRVADNNIIMIIQDTEDYQERFALNTTHLFLNGNWKVIHHDYTQKGIIVITFESIAMP